MESFPYMERNPKFGKFSFLETYQIGYMGFHIWKKPSEGIGFHIWKDSIYGKFSYMESSFQFW